MKALVLQAAGINCDRETARAFELAGAPAEFRHVNDLADAPDPLGGYGIVALPGGFSFGDDVAAGRVLGDRLRRGFGDHLRGFVARGRPVIGICNGFQTLAAGGFFDGDNETGTSCSLADNAGGAFVCRWVSLRKAHTASVWTDGWAAEEVVELPVAHAEGRVVFREGAFRRAAVVYADPSAPLPGDLPANPNASTDGIAGLVDETGLVLGLMPHPERYVEHVQHPAYARRRSDGRPTAEPAGLRLFRAAVRHARG